MAFKRVVKKDKKEEVKYFCPSCNTEIKFTKHFEVKKCPWCYKESYVTEFGYSSQAQLTLMCRNMLDLFKYGVKLVFRRLWRW